MNIGHISSPYHSKGGIKIQGNADAQKWSLVILLRNFLCAQIEYSVNIADIFVICTWFVIMKLNYQTLRDIHSCLFYIPYYLIVQSFYKCIQCAYTDRLAGKHIATLKKSLGSRWTFTVQLTKKIPTNTPGYFTLFIN